MKQTKAIHIIAFDVPFPANYGGVIDIFYKIKAFHDQKIEVILHCFEYGREPAKELLQLCKKVYYYPRKTFKNFLYGDVPYIVASRQSNELLTNLLLDIYPILFEGLHTTSYLKHPALKNRFKIVRTHNVEHDYYHHLEMVEKNFFKRYFFKLESEKLKKYQSILKYADLICAISPNDTAYFQKKFGKTVFIPAFHSNEKIESKLGTGDYILYHGNLAVGENHEAAMFLVKSVFSNLELPFIIAGSHPKKELKQLVNLYEHITIIDDGNTDQINDLISNAQINILYTEQATGIKLKLLNALYKGRHCVVNHKMADNTGLEGLCHIANNAKDFVQLTQELWKKSFNAQNKEQRVIFFTQQFNVKIIIGDLIKAISFDAPVQETKEKNLAKANHTKPKKSFISINSLLGLLPF